MDDIKICPICHEGIEVCKCKKIGTHYCNYCGREDEYCNTNKCFGKIAKKEFDNKKDTFAYFIQPPGVQVKNEGQKNDQDKNRMELLDPYAIEQLCLVLTFGAKKYDPWNWSKGIAYSRLIGAALRHLFAFMAGNDKDDESGLPHLAHCLCCIMFLLSMTKRMPTMDDRNKG